MLLTGLLTACAHRGGLNMPGPLGEMGRDPGAYADRSKRTAVARDEGADIANPRVKRRGAREGEAVAKAAGSFVGQGRLTVSGERYRYDCSGLVEAAYAKAGASLRGSSKDLYELAQDEGLLHRKKRPFVGDIVFFDDTYDRNNNRRRDDELTHVGVVESVNADDTVTVVHLSNSGVNRLRMNLHSPHDTESRNGMVLNDPLRSSGDRDGGPVLAGELWRAFGSLWALSDQAMAAELGCVAPDTI